jgi:GTP pyrophosphokinase
MEKSMSVESSPTSAAKAPKFNEEEVRRQFVSEQRRYLSLSDEVKFILQRRLSETDIKIHDIEQRVKAIDSLLAKAKRVECSDPLMNLHDIVGLRVICLFRHDLSRIAAILRKNFRVLEEEDKSAAGTALGYQSIHYICQLPTELKGARYEDITQTRFEIQIRTLCMHCWATVSHYIDYKGDWDVPQELKLALSALSGLFYVADTEFQQFNEARLSSKHKAELGALSDSTPVEEINLDTVTAFLDSEFPDRIPADADDISKLVLEIKAAGYEKLSDVKRDIEGVKDAFRLHEKSYTTPDTPKYFSRSGVVRSSLALASDKFDRLRGGPLRPTKKKRKKR